MNKIIEQKVLGCIISDKKIQEEMFSAYDSKYFHETLSKKLYNKLKALHKVGKLIDTTLLYTGEESKDLKSYAMDCIASVEIIDCFPQYLVQLKECKIKRDLQILAEQMQEKINDDTDISEMLEMVTQKINGMKPEQKIDKQQLLHDIVTEYSDIRHAGNEMDSGFPAFDNLTHGFKRKRIYILGGLSGTGKTGMALYLAKRMAFEHKKKVLFFSLEMSYFDIVGRLSSILGGVPSWKIQQPWLMSDDDMNKVTDTCRKLNESTLEIVEGNWSKSEIINKIKKDKPDFVVIDHLQQILLSVNPNEKQHEVLSVLVKDLRSAAMSENICIFLLSQNKRNANGSYTDDNIEFRGSSAIKEQADLAMVIKRYDKDKLIEKGLPLGLMCLTIAKNRNGSPGFSNIVLDVDSLTFTEYFNQNKI